MFGTGTRVRVVGQGKRSHRHMKGLLGVTSSLG